MPQRYIMSHTSIRGVAALLVVFYHLQFGTQTYFAWESATPFFEKGYLWVDLFFILSGFVISYSARADARAPYGRAEIRAFYVTRAARIYPLHLVCLFLLFAVLAAQQLIARVTSIGTADPDFLSPLRIAALFEQLALLNAWGLTGLITWNIPSWSISAEMFAYLLFPLLAALIARGRGAALTAIALGALAFYLWVGTTTGILDIVKREAILRCLSGFGIGMILYALRARIDALGSGLLGAAQAVGTVIVLVTMIGGHNDVLAIPGFILLVGATWPDRGWLAALLKTRLLHWLGEISYSVYLNHFWILAGWHFVMERVLMMLGIAPLPGRAVIMIGGIALILAISHLTFRYIEGPARKAIVRRYGRLPASAPQPGLPAGKETA